MRPVVFVLGGLELGGAERATIVLANKLISLGAPVSVAVLTERGPLADLIDERISVQYFGGRSALVGAKQVIKQCPTGAVVVTVQSHVSIAVSIWALWSRRPSQDLLIVANEQGDPAQRQLESRLTRRLYFRLGGLLVARLATRVVACSTELARVVESFSFVRPGTMVTIHNPVSQAHVALAADSTTFPETDVVFAGRLVRQKRVDRLIHAMTLLPELRLRIVGDGPLAGELQALAYELGVDERVEFVGSLINPYPAIASAQVLALTSEWEGLANVLVEALILGVVPVSVDCPVGPAEVLQGTPGVLCRSSDPEDIADALHVGIARAAERNGAPFVDERFDVDRIAAAWLDLLSEISAPDAGGTS